MEAKDYKDHIIQIVTNNNIKAVEILAELIYQADQAKQVLRDKGYGWTGLSLLKTVQDEVQTATYYK